MINNEILENLGLSQKEINIYLACLEGSALGMKELARKSGIQRTHLYDLTKKMVNRGFLVQTKKDGPMVVSARPPREILAMEMKRVERFAAVVPALEKLGKKQTQRPKIVYYEGEREMAKMMEGAGMNGGECLIFSDDLFYTKNNAEYQKKNISQRTKTGTFCRVLAGLSDVTLRSQRQDKQELRETRLFPADIFGARTLITLYRDKVIVANHFRNFGFVVEDRDFADTLKAIFELTWKSGRLIHEPVDT